MAASESAATTAAHAWDRGVATAAPAGASPTAAEDQPVIMFIDEDEGYEAWFRRNRVRYVLNTA